MLIVTMASSIEAYTLNPWNKINSCNNTCPDAPHQSNNPGSKPVTSNGNKAPCTSAGDKHNTRTPESGSKPSPVQRQKKQCWVVTNDTVKRAQSDMGMFWLSNPKCKWTRSSLVTCEKRFVSSSAAGGENASGTPTLFVHFFILVHQRTWNCKPSNSLEITSWQKRSVGLTNITFWNYLD